MYSQSNIKLQESHDKVMDQMRGALNDKKVAIADAVCLRSEIEDYRRKLEIQRAQ